MFAARSKRENTEGFARNTKPNLSSACQLPLSQQAYSTVCRDYQPSVCSPGAAINQTDQLGAWAAELPINSLGHLEAAKPPHVPVHLSGISRRTSSESFSLIWPLLLQNRHLQTGGCLRYCGAVTPKERSTTRPPIWIFMHATISGVIISQDISGKC